MTKFEQLDTLARAIHLASEAHRGQEDLNRQPYVLHCLRVMLERVWPYGTTDALIEELSAAVLHDVVEDTKVTSEEVAAKFGLSVQNLVDNLTHQKGESYAEYIDFIKECDFATRQIKLADLRDNLAEERRANVADKKVLESIDRRHMMALEKLNH